MVTEATRVLDFSVLDGLAFAAERGWPNGYAIPPLKIRKIGPLLEFIQLSKGDILPAPIAVHIEASAKLNRFLIALEGGQKRWVCPDTRSIGFFKTATPTSKSETDWIRFGLVAQKAATESGFPSQTAAQFVAAFMEFYSNIYEHAQAQDTGIVVFHAYSGWFEFVVADRGIGILESLRMATAYTRLNDHGEALELALAEGISRYGSSSGRGYGFQPLFIGLANLNGDLRFRSGDHALTIDGQKPTLMKAKIAQKPFIPGFFISVRCELGQSPKQGL